eukprot:210647_1
MMKTFLSKPALRLAKSISCLRMMTSQKATVKKISATPLAKILSDRIKTSGPIPVSEYMQECLTNEKHGYYTTKKQTIGLPGKGDFLTSPEISSIYGQLLMIWCVNTWEQLGKPKRFHLVELGPGKGTLISGILQTSTKVKDFSRALNIHLVEKSPELIRTQRKKLEVFDSDNVMSLPGKEIRSDEKSTQSGVIHPGQDRAGVIWPDGRNPVPSSTTNSTPGSFSKQTPGSSPNQTPGPFPNHTPGSSRSGPLSPDDIENMPWEELSKRTEDLLSELKGMTSPETRLQCGLTKQGNVEVTWHPSVNSLPKDAPLIIIAHEFFDALPVKQFELTEFGWRERMIDVDKNSEHGFKYVLAKSSTKDSEYFCKDIKNQSGSQKLEIGLRFEVCPETLKISDALAERINFQRGTLLAIDYGADGMMSSTMQAVKEHKKVSVFQEPGEVDLTAHVNFRAIRKQMSRQANVNDNDLVDQTHFLCACGLRPLVEQYVEGKSSDEKQSTFDVANKLADPEGMGGHFKYMCAAHKDIKAPLGFYVPPIEPKGDQMKQ